MHQLIKKIFKPSFENPQLDTEHDGAVIDAAGGKLAFTTDSFVVYPLFFPGGDIGTLAVNGTINDLAMCGARPMCLSASFIIEEGFSMETLWKIAQSMGCAAGKAATYIVTGDIKVVEKGKGHGLFINTSGIGVLEHNLVINPFRVKPGDLIVLNGDIGRHGIAVMAEREGFSFERTVESDCAPLSTTVQRLIEGGIEIHCLRDLTRGGLATSLVEIAESSGKHMALAETSIPVRDDIQGACELLGLDPLYVANEGRFVLFAPPEDARRAVTIMHSESLWPEACIIGEVSVQEQGLVTIKSVIGAERIVDMLSGEQLPRIC
jgi:hydrogenase expression/formation protein HypE